MVRAKQTKKLLIPEPMLQKLPAYIPGTAKNAILNIPEVMARIQAFNDDRAVHNFASTCKIVRRSMKRDPEPVWTRVMSQRPEQQVDYIAAIDYRQGLLLEEQPKIKIGQVLEVYHRNNTTPSSSYIVQKIEKGAKDFKVRLRLLYDASYADKPPRWIRTLTHGQRNTVCRKSLFPRFRDVLETGSYTHLYITESFEDYVPIWKQFYRTLDVSQKWNNYTRGPNLPKWIINLAGKNKHLIPNAQ
jgi:hypothetical protein